MWTAVTLGGCCRGWPYLPWCMCAPPLGPPLRPGVTRATAMPRRGISDLPKSIDPAGLPPRSGVFALSPSDPMTCKIYTMFEAGWIGHDLVDYTGPQPPKSTRLAFEVDVV